MSEILSQLQQVLIQRKNCSAQDSYVASLYNKGSDTILKKLAEETAETIMAVKDGDKQHIIYESADLVFHLLVMLSQQNLNIDQVLAELESRFGRSGIAEKNSRT